MLGGNKHFQFPAQKPQPIQTEQVACVFTVDGI